MKKGRRARPHAHTRERAHQRWIAPSVREDDVGGAFAFRFPGAGRCAQWCVGGDCVVCMWLAHHSAGKQHGGRQCQRIISARVLRLSKPDWRLMELVRVLETSWWRGPLLRPPAYHAYLIAEACDKNVSTFRLNMTRCPAMSGIEAKPSLAPLVSGRLPGSHGNYKATRINVDA